MQSDVVSRTFITTEIPKLLSMLGKSLKQAKNRGGRDLSHSKPDFVIKVMSYEFRSQKTEDSGLSFGVPQQDVIKRSVVFFMCFNITKSHWQLATQAAIA